MTMTVLECMQDILNRRLTIEEASACWAYDSLADLCEAHMLARIHCGEQSDFPSWLAKRDWQIDAIIEQAVATAHERRWEIPVEAAGDPGGDL